MSKDLPGQRLDAAELTPPWTITHSTNESTEIRPYRDRVWGPHITVRGYGEHVEIADRILFSMNNHAELVEQLRLLLDDADSMVKESPSEGSRWPKAHSLLAKLGAPVSAKPSCDDRTFPSCASS